MKEILTLVGFNLLTVSILISKDFEKICVLILLPEIKIVVTDY